MSGVHPRGLSLVELQDTPLAGLMAVVSVVHNSLAIIPSVLLVLNGSLVVKTVALRLELSQLIVAL